VARTKLTPKQKLFCDEYLVDLNATQAAIRAGYSPRTAYRTGCDNLKIPKIQAFIQERMKAKEDELIAKQDEVLKYLTAVMREETYEDVVVVEGDGGGGSCGRVLRKRAGVRDRNKAAELLAKRYGLLTDRIDVTTDIVLDFGGGADSDNDKGD